jgi:hypothetical protein
MQKLFCKDMQGWKNMHDDESTKEENSATTLLRLSFQNSLTFPHPTSFYLLIWEQSQEEEDKFTVTTETETKKGSKNIHNHLSYQPIVVYWN